MRILLGDEPGHITLPSSLSRRYGLEPGQIMLLEKTASGLALHPLRPDVRKVYLEITTRCNLQCRTCVGNVWDEPMEDMDGATFERVVRGLKTLPELDEVVVGGWPAQGGDWLLRGTMELPRMNWGAERQCRFVGSKALVVGWDGAVSPCYALSHSYP